MAKIARLILGIGIFLLLIVGCTFPFWEKISGLFGKEKVEEIVTLDLSGSGLEDLAELAAYTNLRYLYLGNNAIDSLEPISGLEKLVVLDLSYNQLTDIKGIEKLTNLEELYLDGNRISDLSALESLNSLQVLSVADNRIENISVLCNMKKLHSLDISGNEILDFSPIRYVENVIRDGMDGEPTGLQKVVFRDIVFESAVREAIFKDNGDIYEYELTEISELYIGEEELFSLEDVSYLPNLECLILENTQVRDLAPLCDLEKLRIFICTNGCLEYIAPLSEILSLERVALYGNNIVDISPLSDMPHLKYVDVSDNPIENISLLKHVEEVVY